MRSGRLLGTLGFLALATPLEAQYFGQNRVQHRHLDFAVIQTEHFDVYYYGDGRAAAVDGARMAERAYARLSRILGHRYRSRQPLVLFTSHSEFQQNNVTNVGEATGGVTEPFRHRALLPFTGSYADFEHVLQHELVHQFQFDIFAGGVVGAGIHQLVAVNPPLWFMEGMAEYLSLGPIGPQTAMWQRDAAIAHDLPSIKDLTENPRLSPYRFGHALWSFIAEQWGDETISRILHAASVSGVEAAIARTIGLSLDELSRRWHDAVRRSNTPQIAGLEHPERFATPMLTEERSTGTVHLSPALSPDGSRVVYLSEGDSFWIDLYLADARTGAVKRRLIKSAFSADFESLRFLNSTGEWSPDGRFFAFVAKHGGRDDLVIFDMRHLRVHRRIRVPLNGLTTPTWSPDGLRLAFTGYAGGISDLYVVGADGTGLERLTDDRYADLHPAWSPDGRSIAFATDRGPGSNLATLTLAPPRIAVLNLRTGGIEQLPGMDGANTSPRWAPDGQSIAFVSDRTGIPNVFLYELDQRAVYQLTNVATGVSGITPLSPVLTWASRADRLAFSYYENGAINVYAVDDPRGLKRHRYAVADRGRERSAPLSHNRSGRSSPFAPPKPDSTVNRSLPGLSLRSLLDSAALALPDTSEFTFRPYSAKLSPDYVLQPSIGYVRDNYGGGFFGGSAVSLSDMLGNRRLFVGAQVNGRFEEALVTSVYANLSHRINWAVGLSQEPRFYYTGSDLGVDDEGASLFTTRMDRYIVRQVFAQAMRPFSRFRRMELSLRAVSISHDAVDFVQRFEPVTGTIFRTDRVAKDVETAGFLQPSLALVFDNSVSLWVGPFMGRRSRFEYAPAVGGWTYHQVLGDYRRYDHLGGFVTFATRALFFGRFGRDSERFPVFVGSPDLLRGYTAGSFRRHECLSDTEGTYSGCGALDQLVGSRLALVNAELRFPLLRRFGFGSPTSRLPPLEGAIFFDAGIAWNDQSVLVTGRDARQRTAKQTYRTPLASWGFSIRGNVLGFLILRGDYAKPLSRSEQGAYWTLSIGPTF